jgi:large subunit ribosomal protein L21
MIYKLFGRTKLMYALIETCGRQYKVSEGDSIEVENLGAEPGTEVRLDKVLALVKEGGTVFGSPYLSDASVNAEVAGSGKRQKVEVFKQRPRKGYRKRRGHRQPFTTLRIKEIKGD